jgi:AraC family transcriptional regulator, regulatory protein of adaptative response / DNA-3-methyladenine glycosylase II
MSVRQVDSEAQAPPGVMPALAVCQQARLSRDPRFDGRFYIGVLTTGIFCRTICPARLPREDNVRYYPTAAAAQAAGFRPCRRCKPESARQLPEWTLANDTVMRGLRLIEAGYLSNKNTADLAQNLGVSERHLSRLFAQELGASPLMLTRFVRARLAKQLLTDSHMRMADVAFHAGYGSVSRFNAEIREIFHCSPGQLRRHSGSRTTSRVTFKPTLSQPYHFDWMFMYLQRRGLNGVEEVVGGPGDWVYKRLLETRDNLQHWLQVRLEKGELVIDLPLVDEPIHSLLSRVRRVFDLNADADAVHTFLLRDAKLGEWVSQAPGLRVPGAWDGFETAIRAVLGQQVSVERGTTLANKMIDQYGNGLFPTAQQLLGREVAELGMPGRRGQAIVLLAEQITAGGLKLDGTMPFDSVQTQLEAIPGIGPWTANYIRMRVLKDPDAFPDNDWVVMKELNCTAAQARKLARAWQPWRAYGLMYLWYAAAAKRA